MTAKTEALVTALETVGWAQNPVHLQLMERAAAEIRRLAALVGETAEEHRNAGTSAGRGVMPECNWRAKQNAPGYSFDSEEMYALNGRHAGNGTCGECTHWRKGDLRYNDVPLGVCTCEESVACWGTTGEKYYKCFSFARKPDDV